MKQYPVSVRVSHYREIEIEVPDEVTLHEIHHVASAAARIMFKEAESVLVIGWQEKKRECPHLLIDAQIVAVAAA